MRAVQGVGAQKIDDVEVSTERRETAVQCCGHFRSIRPKVSVECLVISGVDPHVLDVGRCVHKHDSQVQQWQVVR